MSRYAGIKGWLANFYATHSEAKFLPLITLYHLSGYESHFGNFKASLRGALEQLTKENTPTSSRVISYSFSDDESDLIVYLAGWKNRASAAALADTSISQ